jgi:small nuclear ribonucleoprotein D1
MATGLKLTKFLEKIVKETVSVELKNSTVVQGQLESVDGSMNISLINVRVQAKDKSPVPMDSISIRGSNVRYVILPDHLSLDQLLFEAASADSRSTSKQGAKKVATKSRH